MPKVIKNESYRGPERRMDEKHHDEVCDRRLGWIKTAVYILVVTIFLSGAYGYTQNEGMQAKNDTQDLKIGRNAEEIAELKGSMNEHMREQKVVNKEVLTILQTLKTDMAVIKKNTQ